MGRRNLREHACDASKTFAEVGGTAEMYYAATFLTESQAFYAGQLRAYNRVLYAFGQSQVDMPEDYAAHDREYEEYA